MKIINYNIYQSTDENGKDIVLPKRIECKNEAEYEANLPIAQAESHDGRYTVEDDGKTESQAVSTVEERLAVLESALRALISV